MFNHAFAEYLSSEEMKYSNLYASLIFGSQTNESYTISVDFPILQIQTKHDCDFAGVGSLSLLAHIMYMGIVLDKCFAM